MNSTVFDQLNPTQPFVVPDHIGAVQLITMNNGDAVPAAVDALIGSSPTHYGLRISGGCSGMSAADREHMLAWFTSNLADFSGLVSSGATREVTDGHLDPMVTEVPALLAARNPDTVVTISTVPRVGRQELVDQSRLRLLREDQWGTSVVTLNPGVHMIIMVQHALGDNLDWDGDVATYIDHFNVWRRRGWQFCNIVWNGGGVTKTELKRSLQSGWPVFVVEGSGRAADEYADAVRSGTAINLALDEDEGPVPYDPTQHQLYVVSQDDPHSLKQGLSKLGYPA